MSILQAHQGGKKFSSTDIGPGTSHRLWSGKALWSIYHNGQPPTDAECRAYCEPTKQEEEAERDRYDKIEAKKRMSKNGPESRMVRACVDMMFELHLQIADLAKWAKTPVTPPPTISKLSLTQFHKLVLDTIDADDNKDTVGPS